ncbi:MAG: bifunctional sugar-1-phosphate nucleotidylyltransferase/acetyltransferase [Candidatus Hydrogenedentota bacterium]
MQAIIMAAGKATRTVPLTLTRPKALLPVMNRPLIELQLDALHGVVDEVVVVVGYKAAMIRDHLGSRYRDLTIRYVIQSEQRGTGHAVLECASAVDAPFLVINGDDLYDPRDLEALAAQEQAALALEVPDPRRFGVYEVDANDRVRRLVEKPANPASNLANIGAYKFTPAIFDVLHATPPAERGEIELTSGIQTLAERGAFRVVRASGYYLSIGYAWHLLEANAFWLENFLRPEVLGAVHPGAHLLGAVYVGRGTVIHPGAVIEGPAYIGQESEIGPNCHLRLGATVGDRCKVGQASEIKSSILMNGAKAPHQNYVGDSIIGEGVNLGCGTNTANLRHDQRNIRSMIHGELVDTGRRKLGAIIGDHVHTGINTAIYPGRKFWPNTSTPPGAVIRHDRME